MRSLQIRGLSFIGPKLDFLSIFEISALLKTYDPVRHREKLVDFHSLAPFEQSAKIMLSQHLEI